MLKINKIAAIASCLVCGSLAAMAQYAPTTLGSVLTYTVKETEPEQVTKTETMTLDSILSEDGLTKLRFLNRSSIPGTLRSDPDMYTYVLCDPDDPKAPTVDIMMDPEVFKNLMVDEIKEEVSSNGMSVSDSDIEQMRNMIRTSGRLALTLDPTAAPDTKIENSSLRINLEMMSMSMRITGGKVEGTETITVPAGEFTDCLKVSYSLKRDMGAESSKYYCTAWYAPGVGLVKDEMKDKKQNIVESRELISITVPQ